MAAAKVAPGDRRYSGLRVTELGFGAAVLVWCLRASATGHAHCPPVVTGMDRALGPDGDEGRIHILSLVRTLADAGHRTLHMTHPGGLGVTYDEVALVSALSASQKRLDTLRDAQLAWVLGTAPPPDLCDAVQRLGGIFLRSGHTIQAPNLPLPTLTSFPAPKPIWRPRNVHPLFD
ncbi:MAG: hypothetical protein WBG08_11295 [Litorimonas sp.]